MRNPKDIKIREYTLAEILERHLHWWREDCEGWEAMRANLYGANLSRADLSGANLSRANLSRANLSGADLSGADLSRADLSGANLSGADLSRADLSGANLSGANLSRADLSGANLSGADLSRADLSRADLSRADLSGADLSRADLSRAENVPFIPMACPDTGAFIAWKKAQGCIVKLMVPETAKRSSSTGRKCRCDKAKVIQIESMDGEVLKAQKVSSDRDAEFIYTVGEIVSVDDFNENRWIECAPGIHFFINRQEAVEY